MLTAKNTSAYQQICYSSIACDLLSKVPRLEPGGCLAAGVSGVLTSKVMSEEGERIETTNIHVTEAMKHGKADGQGPKRKQLKEIVRFDWV